MNINDIDLNLLRVFEAVFIEENISRASERLGISQPATSNALNRLRQTFNDPLFVRSGGSMVPTPRAEEIAEPIRSALALIQSSLDTGHNFDYTKASATFNLAMSDYSEYIIMPHLLKIIATSAPGITIQTHPIEGGNLGKAILKRKIDLAIGNIPFLSDGSRSQRLLSDHFVCMVRQNHPTIKDKLDMKHFLEYGQITLNPRARAFRSPVDDYLNEEGLKRRVVMRIPNALALPALVEDTDFIAIVPFRIAKRFCEIYDLKQLDFPIEISPITIKQYWHERVHKEPGHQWLRQTLYNICQRL